MSNEGVWLDRVPYKPPLVGCVGCGDPLTWGEVMVKVVGERAVTPLCPVCFRGYSDGVDEARRP